MGKVYDALRRAEEQRAQRRAGAAGLPAPFERAPERAPAAIGEPEAESRLADWLRVLRRPQPVGRPAEGGSAINKRRIAMLQPDSYVAEQFRTLRTRIESLGAERPARTLVVTSALPGEGKTLAAVNLALVMSMSVGRRVLLVECDLRRPQLHSVLGLRPALGLAEVLADPSSIDAAILPVEGSRLEVLPVRGAPPNPSELLASERMHALVEELARRYDQVVFDTPPTLSLPDAKTVSEMTDGIVLVVRADETPQEDVQAALDVLDRRRVLGAVLNDAKTDVGRYAY